MEIKDIIQTEGNLHRLDQQQVYFLAEMTAEMVNNGLRNKLPNVCRDRKTGKITHGLMKGMLSETGERRTIYFERILKTLTK